MLCCCIACSDQETWLSDPLASRPSEDSHERKLAGGEDFRQLTFKQHLNGLLEGPLAPCCG